jgi:hypothetical protein
MRRIPERQFRKLVYPHAGVPGVHEEIEWYEREDNQVAGAVVRDKTDKDYGWVLLGRKPHTHEDSEPSRQGFGFINVKCSFPTAEAARLDMFANARDEAIFAEIAAVKEWAARGASSAD